MDSQLLDYEIIEAEQLLEEGYQALPFWGKVYFKLQFNVGKMLFLAFILGVLTQYLVNKLI
jgi:hypothetical protein